VKIVVSNPICLLMSVRVS